MASASENPKSENTPAPVRVEPPSSPWRLVNLALGLAAILIYAGAFIPQLVPSRWLLAPWLTPSSTSALSPATIFATRIGVNFWLPAAVFMLLFCVIGLHRKVGAARRRWASAILLFAWVTSVALTLLPVMAGRSQAGGVLVMVLGMYLGFGYPIIAIAACIAAAAELAAIGRHPAVTPSPGPAALVSWAVIPLLLFMLPLLFAPSHPLAQSAKESSGFAGVCKDVGVKLMDKPAGPVRSVAYDWDPQRWKVRPEHNGRPGRHEVDAEGRLKGIHWGKLLMPNSPEAQKTLTLDFVETRGGVNPDGAYYRFPGDGVGQPQPVDALTADVVAFLDVDKPEELRKAPRDQGALRYTVQLTDRRSGAILGVQTYVIDRANLRACGANVGNYISPQAFIYDATNR